MRGAQCLPLMHPSLLPSAIVHLQKNEGAASHNKVLPHNDLPLFSTPIQIGQAIKAAVLVEKRLKLRSSSVSLISSQLTDRLRAKMHFKSHPKCSSVPCFRCEALIPLFSIPTQAIEAVMNPVGKGNLEFRSSSVSLLCSQLTDHLGQKCILKVTPNVPLQTGNPPSSVLFWLQSRDWRPLLF